MAEPRNPSPAEDSLDIVERVMAIEEALIDPCLPLAPNQRERLIREIEARITGGEFGDEGDFVREIIARIANSEFGDAGDFDDDALAAVVRKPGPRSPRGQAGAAAQPEALSFE
jgi:hypothetical protein